MNFDAKERINHTLGTQYVENEILKDQVAALQQQVAEKDAKIASLVQDLVAKDSLVKPTV